MRQRPSRSRRRPLICSPHEPTCPLKYHLSGLCSRRKPTGELRWPAMMTQGQTWSLFHTALRDVSTLTNLPIVPDGPESSKLRPYAASNGAWLIYPILPILRIFTVPNVCHMLPRCFRTIRGLYPSLDHVDDGDRHHSFPEKSHKKLALETLLCDNSPVMSNVFA
jgi:hypothetical protein